MNTPQLHGMKGCCLRSLVGTEIDAEAVTQPEEAGRGQTAAHTGDRDRRPERPRRGMVLADQPLQLRGHRRDPARTGNGGPISQIQVGDCLARPGRGGQDGLEPVGIGHWHGRFGLCGARVLRHHTRPDLQVAMLLLNSVAFNLLLVVTTVVLGLPGLLLLPLDRRWCCRLRDLWIRILLAGLRATVGLGFRVEGREHLPDAPRFLVAAKHQSAWETLALHLVLPDPAFVMKRELLRLPIIGWYMAKVGMVPIDRSGGARALRAMIAAAHRVSATGRPIVVFPQGTRVAPGADAPYHSGLYAVYRALDVPVVPLALNSGYFWPRQAFVKKPGTVTIRLLPAIEPGLERSEFMRRVRTEIETASRALGQAL